MIGKLTGQVDGQGDDWMVLDVGGVGYEVHCGARTLGRMPAVGEPLTLFIETHVREDAIRLYGFESADERAWFRALQSVQGVGAKVALAVLSSLSTDDLTTAIVAADTARIAQAQGVGPKVAKRIATELKDKAVALAPAAAVGLGRSTEEPVSSAQADALSALINLGYGRGDASAAVARAITEAGSDAQTEQLIRLGLKDLAR